jgi:hypothetical protein
VAGALAVAAAMGAVSALLRPTGLADAAVLALQVLTGAVALAALLAVGPLSEARREIATRLVHAGYLSAPGPGRLVDRLLR